MAEQVLDPAAMAARLYGPTGVKDKASSDGGTEKTTEQKVAAPVATPAQDKGVDDGTANDGDGQNNEDVKSLWEPESQPLKLPEGVIADPALMSEFQEWAKASGFDQAQAQRAADMHLKSIAVFAQKQAQEFEAEQRSWTDEIRNDTELGGAKLQATQQRATRFIEMGAQVPGVNLARLKQDLDRTGMGNHPDLIRLAHYFAGLLPADAVGRQPANTPKDMATRLYGSTGVTKR